MMRQDLISQRDLVVDRPRIPVILVREPAVEVLHGRSIPINNKIRQQAIRQITIILLREPVVEVLHGAPIQINNRTSEQAIILLREPVVHGAPIPINRIGS